MTTIAEAMESQTGLSGYQVDQWEMGTITMGTRLYKMMPSRGGFFFDYASYREWGADPRSMYAGTQVEVSKKYPLRVVAVEFTVQTTFSSPTALCGANAHFGVGGARQYFINDADRAAFLLQTSSGWGLDGKGIGYF